MAISEVWCRRCPEAADGPDGLCAAHRVAADPVAAREADRRAIVNRRLAPRPRRA